MSNISKIKISGTSYSLKDENACKVVELTQAQYDALPTTAKTSNSLFVITDAKAGDLSNYYTKTETDGLLDTKLDVTAYTPTDLSNYYTKSETSGATEISTALSSKADTATTYTKTETDNAITAATSTKQDTLVSGTNIKTINSQSILGEGNIEIQSGGGSITIDQSLDSGSTNPVANSAITNAIYNQTARFNGNASDGYLVSLSPYEDENYIGIIGGKIKTLANSTPQSSSAIYIYTSTINGKKALSTSSSNTKDFSLVETSAFTAHTADTVIHVTSSEKAAWNDKQDTLVSGTNIKTINNQSILGEGNITIEGGGGGGMTEDDELLLSTALTDLNDRKIDASEVKSQLGNYQKKGDYATKDYVTTALEPYETKLDGINTEEVTAYALNDINNRFGGLSLVKITESEYSALTTKDENTLYIVVADQS